MLKLRRRGTFMSIFDTIWRRKGRPPSNQPDIENDPTFHITMTDRDYSALLEQGDVAIKIWLPELMGDILDQNCSGLNTGRSDLVRQMLFTYLYGKHDWFGLYERNESHYSLKPNRGIRFSRSAVEEPEGVLYQRQNITKDLGKNIEDLKVWIPQKMKEDIQSLAARSAISLSEMIREIIISTLIGHTYLSARNELLQMRIEVDG